MFLYDVYKYSEMLIYFQCCFTNEKNRDPPATEVQTVAKVLSDLTDQSEWIELSSIDQQRHQPEVQADAVIPD